MNSFHGYSLCRVSKKSVFGGYSEKMQKYKFSKSRFIILYVRLERTYTGLFFGINIISKQFLVVEKFFNEIFKLKKKGQKMS